MRRCTTSGPYSATAMSRNARYSVGASCCIRWAASWPIKNSTGLGLSRSSSTVSPLIWALALPPATLSTNWARSPRAFATVFTRSAVSAVRYTRSSPFTSSCVLPLSTASRTNSSYTRPLSAPAAGAYWAASVSRLRLSARSFSPA